MNENDGLPGSTERAWELLGSNDLGRLVTLGSGRDIGIYPINYVCLAGQVLLRTHPGSKLLSVAMHPDVVFEVDDRDRESGTAWSVVIHASAHIDQTVWASIAADAAGLTPDVKDMLAEDIVVLNPVRITLREFTLR